MSAKQCVVAGCDKSTVISVHRAWNHRIGQEVRVCADHIEGFLHRYYEMQSVGQGSPSKWGGAIAFDVEMVLLDERQEKPCQFSLREVGGMRRVDCQTGVFEAAALLMELARAATRRPLTHRAMASLLTALGGRLDRVLVDKFLTVDRIYEAKLHIHQAEATVLVDVRISDAVILAVICDVPIFVSEDVLGRLPK